MAYDELDRDWIKKHILKMRPQIEKVEDFNPNTDCLSLNEIVERLELDLKLLERWRALRPGCGDT